MLKKLSEYLDCKYAIGVADGTMGLLLSLIASGIKQGDEVLVPSHTFIATAAAIKHTGAKPVLLDCADDHLVDIDKIKVYNVIGEVILEKENPKFLTNVSLENYTSNIFLIEIHSGNQVLHYKILKAK